MPNQVKVAAFVHETITNMAVSQIMNVLNFISKIDPDNAKITNIAVSQIMNVLNFL